MTKAILVRKKKKVGRYPAPGILRNHFVAETSAGIDTCSRINSLLPSDEVPYLLLHGDAETELRKLPEGLVHCAITSPPYWRQRTYESGSGLGAENDRRDYISRLVRIFRELRRVLRKDGSFWLNIGDTYYKKQLCGIPWQAVIALQADGWILRNAIIWDKVKGNPDNSKDKLRNMYEFIFHLVMSEEYYYNADEIRNPPGQPSYKNGKVVTPTGVSGGKYKRQIVESKDLSSLEKANALKALTEALRKVTDGRMPDFRMIIRGCQRSTHSDSPEFSGRATELIKRGFCILPYHANGTKPGDVWRIIPEDEWRKDQHYAVFPKEICQIPIKATSPKGGLVLDPFAGTGTTLVAAIELGRRGIGIDTSAEYLGVARHRAEHALQIFSETQSQRTLF